MLIGEYQHSLDTKGRVNFPVKIREQIGERFTITRGLDRCIFVYSDEGWRQLEEKLSEMPMSKARDLQRFFFGPSVDVEPDKQGRVLIPQTLRDYAKLEKDIIIVGAGKRAEIWDKDRWMQKLDEITEKSDKMDETMDEMGF